MILLDKNFKSGNGIGVDLNFQNKNIALPFSIGWFKYGIEKTWFVFDLDIHFLCFSLHFEYSNWSEVNEQTRTK